MAKVSFKRGSASTPEPPKQKFGQRAPAGAKKPEVKAPPVKKPEAAKKPEVKKEKEKPKAAAPKAAAPKSAAPLRRISAPTPPEESSELVPESQQQLALPTEIGGVEGEINRSDLIFPTLKIVQAIGPLSENFEPGGLILSGEIPIGDGGADAAGLDITVLSAKKQYVENTEWGSEEIARVFDTEEEVRANGGWTEWKDNVKPPFSPVLHALVAIECPDETVLDHFPFEFNGTHYAPAMMTLKGSAFTTLGKMIITQAQYNLKSMGLHFGKWHLNTAREKRGENFVWVPRAKRMGLHDEETADFLKGIANG